MSLNSWLGSLFTHFYTQRTAGKYNVGKKGRALYTVIQGHSMSSKLVPVESPYVTSY